MSVYEGMNKLTEHEVPEGSSPDGCSPKITTALYCSAPAINNFAP
jgi:hypothetical protein